MKQRRPLIAVMAMILAAGVSGCGEKDDPESLTATLTVRDAGQSGVAGTIDGATWQTEEVVHLLGATPSLFSVGPGLQVRFSRGNLQYDVEKGRWQFAERQYETAAHDGGVVDLFGWGTSGWESGALSIQPTSTDGADSTYWPGMQPLASIVGDYAEADWAVHNAIVNGGGRAHLWRVLTAGEWLYLLGNSDERRGKWGLATIEGGHQGLVVLPDAWKQPANVAFATGAEGWETNVYTTMQWNLMEKAGAVFLPAGGYRDGGEVSSVGVTGNYWSSTAVDSSCAADIFFRAHQLNVADFDLKHYGFAVRPVLE